MWRPNFLIISYLVGLEFQTCDWGTWLHFPETCTQPNTPRNLPVNSPWVFWSVPSALSFTLTATLVPSQKEGNAHVMELLFSRTSLQLSPNPSSHRPWSLIKILRTPKGGRNGEELPNPFHYFKGFGMHSSFGWIAANSQEASIASGMAADNGPVIVPEVFSSETAAHTGGLVIAASY